MASTRNDIDYEKEIYQVNGQRIYGGPPRGWIGDVPKIGTEVYIGGLPRHIKENAFLPLFAKMGVIYCSRLMVDFSGSNRGFAFIQYATVAEAKQAINHLNGYEILRGKKLNVKKSVNNCRLFVGHLPKTVTRDQVENVLRTYTNDVKQIFIYYSPSDKTKNRGFCFVEYENHRAACLARRRFFTAGIPEWPYIKIDWAIPEEEVDEEVMKWVTVMYLRNLMLKTSVTILRGALLRFVEAYEIFRIRKVNDFAFVHFSNRGAATKCINAMNGYTLDGAEIFADWAKPAFALENIGKHLKTNRKQSNECVNSRTKLPVNQKRSLNPDQVYVNEAQQETLNSPKDIFFFFLSESSPATALQKMYNYFGWGTVVFKVWFQTLFASQQYIATIEIHYNDGRVIRYGNLCHKWLNSPEEAKDVAAQVFVGCCIYN